MRECFASFSLEVSLFLFCKQLTQARCASRGLHDPPLQFSLLATTSLRNPWVRGNQLAIIASTPLIGLLFKPLHDRMSALIDRRFYRRKYDEARTIATFSATIRDEVDLNQLGTKLTAVVEETMQPAYVSVWLCPPKRYLEDTTPALPFIDKEEGLQ